MSSYNRFYCPSSNGDESDDGEPNQSSYYNFMEYDDDFSDSGSCSEESYSSDQSRCYNVDGLSDEDDASYPSSESSDAPPMKRSHEKEVTFHNQEVSSNIEGHDCDVDLSPDLYSTGLDDELSFSLTLESSELSDLDDELSVASNLQSTEQIIVARKSSCPHHMKDADFDTTLQSTIEPPKKFNMSPSNILFVGLLYVGFNANRQMKSGLDRNMRRFLTFFGVGPKTIQALFADLTDKNPALMFKDLMMTLNWFKLYDPEPVLEGRWDCCSEYIGPKLKEIGRMIQALLPEKIKFEYSDDDVIVMSLDTVNYTIQEPRKTPSTKWFDPKSHSAGLKYEHGLSLTKPKQVWLRGPQPAAHDDITFFRGGKKDEKKEDWDKSALYFKIPHGKRAIADNGYKGEPDKILTTKDEHSSQMKKWIGRVKARQESLHTRLKSFQILKYRFRHGKSTELRLKLHQMAVECVCVIVQFDFENGHPPMDV